MYADVNALFAEQRFNCGIMVIAPGIIMVNSNSENPKSLPKNLYFAKINADILDTNTPTSVVGTAMISVFKNALGKLIPSGEVNNTSL